MTPRWRAYHETTKHTVEKILASTHRLDWANMPDPFRHYEGVPVADLPAETAPVDAAAIEIVCGGRGRPTARDGGEFLSQLLFHSAAISATKVVPSSGYRYALRVNPSSGNLHPTEFHFATRGLRGWEDGLYHYRPSSHMAELRARGDYTTALGVGAPVVFVLTTIAWREAWKYRDRAYRYCLLDAGHAWEALTAAASALGCDARAVGLFDDDGVARLLGADRDEWPMLAIGIDGAGVPAEPRGAADAEWFGGHANRLSESVVTHRSIEQVHDATKVRHPMLGVSCAVQVEAPYTASRATFAEVARRRRSALDFRGGAASISIEQLRTCLAAAARGHNCDFPCDAVRLYLYVHRVEGLERGTYTQGLELLHPGDQRVTAAGLSLSQQLAGNSCFTVSMVADLARLTGLAGDRGYRYAHFLAGAIGQRLYLAADAMGFQSTGIGAFYDDAVHRHLGLAEQGSLQVVYHFASGYALQDNRLEIPTAGG